MIYLVYLGNLLFTFDTAEAAVSFLEKAKIFYYHGENPSFTLQILNKEEFKELENKISEEKEKIKVLKEKGR